MVNKGRGRQIQGQTELYDEALSPKKGKGDRDSKNEVMDAPPVSEQRYQRME